MTNDNFFTVKHIMWKFIERFSVQFISFVITVILSRLLDPVDYGLLAVSLLFISLFELILNNLFTFALVQKKNPTDEDYYSVLVTNFFILGNFPSRTIRSVVS